MEFEISVDRCGDYAVIHCGGDLDTYHCGKLRSAVANLIDEGLVRVVIDLSDLEYVDSTGLGSLVGALKRLSDHQGKLAIVVTKPEITKVLEMTRLNTLFKVVSSSKEGIAIVMSGYSGSA